MTGKTIKCALVCIMAVPVAAAECSDAWENCTKTMCCGTPFFECVEKNQAQKKDGEVISAYAQCRFANASAGKSSCPCKNPPCIDIKHDGNAKVKLPWSCIILTGGCSAAYGNCGPGQNLDAKQKKGWTGTPCCQWGCTCNYSIDWNAQCQPAAGMYACTKEAEKEQEKGQKLFAVTEDVAPAPNVLYAGLLQWIAGGAGIFSLLVTVVALVLRKTHIRRGEEQFFEEVGDVSG